MTKNRKLILMIYNLSSLLTRRNLVRITTYIRLFGIKTTFNEIIRGEERAGEERSGRQRALNITGGLAGSEFATAGDIRVDEETRKIIEERRREQAKTIANVFPSSEGRTSAEL